MYKKLRKFCAWALAVVTVVSLVPSSGLVMADETDTSVNAEVEQGTIYFKVPDAGGQVLVTTDKDTEDENTQIITVTDEKTTLTDKDGNETDVALTEEGYSLEITGDVESVVDVEILPAEGYEVGTYHILSDTGDVVDEPEISSENKYEVTISKDIQVVEVLFNTVKTQSETTEETEVVEEPTETEEVTEEVTEPVEETTEESQESNESVTTYEDGYYQDIHNYLLSRKPAVMTRSANSTTDNTIVDTEHTVAIKYTLADSTKVKDGDTIDSIYSDIDRASETILGQYTSTARVYDMGLEDSYVAFLDSTLINGTAKIIDWEFAINDFTGTTVDSIEYDSESGIAYIPKSLYFDGDTEKAFAVQAQLLVSYDFSDSKVNIGVSVENSNENVETTNTDHVKADTLDITTTIPVATPETASNICLDDLTVHVNDKETPEILNEDTASYNMETGELTLRLAPITTLNVDVEVNSVSTQSTRASARASGNGESLAFLPGRLSNFDTSKAYVGSLFKYETAITYCWPNSDTQTNRYVADISKKYCYGYINDPESLYEYMAYASGANWFGLGNLQNMTNSAEFNCVVEWPGGVINGVDFSGFEGWANVPDYAYPGNYCAIGLLCAHISNPVDYVGNSEWYGQCWIRVLALNTTASEPYVVLGFCGAEKANQSGSGIYKIKIGTPTGSGYIVKTSSNTSLTSGNSNYNLTGATYNIYKTKSDAQNNKNAISGKQFKIASNSGKSNTVELNAGTYYIKEVPGSDGTGYTTSSTVYTITITAGKTNVNLTPSGGIKNTPKTATIDLYKTPSNPVCVENNENYSLEGAVYGVYTNKSCTSLKTKATTNADGEFSVTGLPLGQYWVKEISPSPGYLLDTNVYAVDARTEGSGPVRVFTVESHETPILDPDNLLLRKVDSNTNGAPEDQGTMEGAEFEVKFYGIAVDEIADGTDPATLGYQPTRTWVLKTYTTSNGSAALIFDNAFKVSGDDFYYTSSGDIAFPFGVITIKETKAPNGYLINDQVIVQKITDANGGNDSTIIDHVPTQLEDSLTLRVVKTQYDTEKVIPGVTYRWTRPDGTVNTYTTDKNGVIEFHGLTWGKHTIEEIDVPDGYAVNTNKIEFTVAQDNTITFDKEYPMSDTNGVITISLDTEGNMDVDYTNKPAPFDLKIHKVNNHNFPLEGAEFTLYSDEKCTQVVDVQVTDSDGELTFADLIPYKEYWMKETDAPPGYRIPVNDDGSDIIWKIDVESVPVNDEFTFNVNDTAYTVHSTGSIWIDGTKADRVCNMTVVNEVGMKLPNTGSSMMILLLIAGVMLMGGAIVISRKSRKTSDDKE